MDQVTIVRRLLDHLHAMRTYQVTCEETKKELENEQRLINSSNTLSPRAYIAIKAIEDILLSDQKGNLSNYISLTEKSTSLPRGITMKDFTEWAAHVNWLLSIMEGFKPSIM